MTTKFEYDVSGKDMKEQRNTLKFIACTAEHCERYEDMAHYMALLVKLSVQDGVDLSVEERNLLSVAYKNVIGTRRTSWRTLSDPNNPQFDEIVAEYRAQVEKELDAICAEVLDLLTSYLIKDDTSNDEAQVFYLKMAGDYFRYRAESVVGMDYAKQSALYYGKAYSKAQDSLKATHPIRLGLALNYSVCHYEILKNRKEACELAKKAFDMAIQELDELPEASYKDSTLIMQLLRDNLTLWTSGSQDEYEIDADDGVEVQDIGDEDL